MFPVLPWWSLGHAERWSCAFCSRVTECSSCFINYIKRENSLSKHYQIDTTAINSSMKLVLLLSVVGIVAISNCFARSKYMKCFTTTHSQHNLIRLFQSNVNRVVLLWCLYKMKLGFFFLSDSRTWLGFSCVTFWLASTCPIWNSFSNKFLVFFRWALSWKDS